MLLARSKFDKNGEGLESFRRVCNFAYFTTVIDDTVLLMVSMYLVRSTTIHKYWRGSRKLAKSMQFAGSSDVIDDTVLLTLSIYLVRSTTIQNIDNC